jgi:hypothetical protein
VRDLASRSADHISVPLSPVAVPFARYLAVIVAPGARPLALLLLLSCQVTFAPTLVLHPLALADLV